MKKSKLVLATQTVRPLSPAKLDQVSGASGTLCQSGTPTVSSMGPTCR